MTIAPSYTRSVTKNDYNDGPRSGRSVFHLFAPMGGNATHIAELPRELPKRWSNAADQIMRDAICHESLWATAVAAGIAQSVGMTFEITQGQPQLAKKFKNLLNYANGGQGWKLSFLPKIKTDFLSTRMGFVIEIARAKRAYPSAVTGLFSLDACRCRRTGDPDYPIIYEDLQGHEHILPWYNVAYAAHMPSPKADEYGLGYPAVAVAWKQIVKLAEAERHIYQKITGSGITSIDIIAGIDDVQLKEIIDTAKLGADQKAADEGQIYAYNYLGSILSGALNSNVDFKHLHIPLTGFPDNFDIEKERGWALNIYANAVGLDPQILAPLIGGELGGTSRQSKTLQEYRDQRVGIAFDEALTHIINDWIIPNDNEFYFNTVDLNQLYRQAEVDVARIAVIEKLRQVFPNLPEDKLLAMAADHDLIPKEFVDEDQRQFDGLSEDEKVRQAEEQPAQEQPASQADKEQVATKATDDELDDLIDSEMKAALDWAKAIQSED